MRGSLNVTINFNINQLSVIPKPPCSSQNFTDNLSINEAVIVIIVIIVIITVNVIVIIIIKTVIVIITVIVIVISVIIITVIIIVISLSHKNNSVACIFIQFRQIKLYTKMTYQSCLKNL